MLNYINPDNYAFSIQEIENLIQSLIPIELCRRYKLIPIKREGTNIIVAMVDPENLEAEDDLMRILRPHKIKLKRAIISRDNYEKLMDQYYELESRLEQDEKEEDINFSPDLVDIVPGIEETSNNILESEQTGDEGEKSPITRLINKILTKALEQQASEIHIEPQESCLKIRFREDGVLHPVWDNLPLPIASGIVAQCKMMANLEITERRSSQEGKFSRIFQSKKIDFRVNILPNNFGEKIVIQVLGNFSENLTLDHLIIESETLGIVKSILSNPDGLLLVTGPGNAGKTASLYSILAQKNNQEVNIATVEEWITYSLPGITQIELNSTQGLDYDKILSSFIHQDVDVILLDNILDFSRANILFKLAEKGKLVLTSLDAKNASTAVVRLNHMGIKPFIIAETLIGVINQRLIRRLCPTCCINYYPSEAKLAKLGLSYLNQRQFYRSNHDPNCPTCQGKGYKGQIGVYEVLPITKNIKSLIAQNADAETINNAAQQEGMKSLFAYAVGLLLKGETSLEEIERVIPLDKATTIYSSTAIASKSSATPSNNTLQKLEKLEKMLAEVTLELQNIKQELQTETPFFTSNEDFPEPW